MPKREFNHLTPPIGEQDHVQGPATAPVTLVEYGDYECPYCQAAMHIVVELQRLLGEQLRFSYRHFPISNLHPHALHAAEAAEAAASQGKFWEMHAYLFEHRQALDDEHLVRYASDLGLDTGRFRRELEEHIYESRVRADFSSGIESGVDGTPTFYLDGLRYDAAMGVQQMLDSILRTHTGLQVGNIDQVHQRRIPRVVGQRSYLQPRQ